MSRAAAAPARKKNTPPKPLEVVDATVLMETDASTTIENYCPKCDVLMFSLNLSNSKTVLKERTCDRCNSVVRVIELADLVPIAERIPVVDDPTTEVGLRISEEEQDHPHLPETFCGLAAAESLNKQRIEEPELFKSLNEEMGEEKPKKELTMNSVFWTLFIGLPCAWVLTAVLLYILMHWFGFHPEKYINRDPAQPAWYFVMPPSSSGEILKENNSSGDAGMDTLKKLDGSGVTTAAILPFALRMEVSKKCWVNVDDRGDLGNYSGSQVLPANDSMSFPQTTSATVRAGCPNDIQFWINGNPAETVNEAEHPDKVGLYHFPAVESNH